jgi:hypothetical protein
MKKTLRPIVLMILTLVLGAVAASALDLAPVCKTPAPAVATAQPAPVPAVAQAAQPPAVDLFMPDPKPAAICPLIGCVNDEYCRRDRDCTTAPGGTCNLFCPTQGCCAYP